MKFTVKEFFERFPDDQACLDAIMASRMGDKPGGQFELPRAILRASCNHFYEMAPDTIKEATLCCGGGGGLLTDDLMDLRMKGAQPRMRAMQQVAQDHGVTHLAAICAICKAQFTKVLPKYGFKMDSILSVHQMVANAIVLDGSIQAKALETKAAARVNSDLRKGVGT